MGIPTADLNLARQRGFLVIWLRDFDRFQAEWCRDRKLAGKPIIIISRESGKIARMIWLSDFWPMTEEQLKVRSIAIIASALHRGAGQAVAVSGSESFGLGLVPFALALDVANELVELARVSPESESNAFAA